MGIVSMNCPNCGAQLEMDDSREFGYCTMCGSKVMVDKVIVEHKGSIRIDQSEKVKSNLILARRARENGDNDTAQRCYEIVLNEEPNNWEAYFYSIICSTYAMKYADIASAIGKVSNCFNSAVLLIDQEVSDMEKCFQAKNEVGNVSVTRLVEIYGSAHAFWLKINGIGLNPVSVASDASVSAISYCKLAIDKAVSIIMKVDVFSNSDRRYRKVATELYKLLLSTVLNTKWYAGASKNNILSKERVNAIENRIREDEPEYKSSVESSSGGCYVATCVYGSYDCPQVWTLRRYRDDTLAATWYGRAFIRTYYAVSPTLVKWFGHTGWFKKMWQGKLDRMVKRLNASGVADTPYADKKW